MTQDQSRKTQSKKKTTQHLSFLIQENQEMTQDTRHNLSSKKQQKKQRTKLGQIGTTRKRDTKQETQSMI